MKRFLFFITMLIGLSACEFYYLEPRYDARDRIVGSHDVEEYSETYNDYTYYTIYIERSSGHGNILIDNFYGVDISVCATVVGDKITIHRQVVNGYEVEGIGTIYGDEIDFHFSVDDLYSSSRTDFCEAIAYRW